MSLLPTGGKGYRLGVGWVGKTGDSQFRPRNLSAPINFFMVSVAPFFGPKPKWRLLYGFGPFTGTARDALIQQNLYHGEEKN
jgi:hypothetical protein